MNLNLINLKEDNSMYIFKPGTYKKEEDGKISIYIHYSLFLEYRKGDKLSERFAIVVLSRNKLTSQVKIAEAFGYHRNIIAGYVKEYNEYGLVGLVDSKKGPGTNWKLTPEITKALLVQISQPERIKNKELIKYIERRYGTKISIRSIQYVKRIRSKKSSKGKLKKQAQQGLFNNGAEENKEKSGVGRISKRRYEARLRKGIITNYGGGLLLNPFLDELNFERIIKSRIKDRDGFKYSGKEILQTIFFMTNYGFHSVESFKTVLRAKFGLLIGRPTAPEVKTIRYRLNEIAFRDKLENLIIDMGQQFIDKGIIELGTMYYDGHFIPYYGDKSTGKGYYPQIKNWHRGSYHYSVNDKNGRPLFFMLEGATSNFTEVIPNLIKRTIELIGNSDFTIVFDRGGYSGKLFCLIDELGVKFITYDKYQNKKYSDEVFKPLKIAIGRRRKKNNGVYETEKKVKHYGQIRNVIVKTGEKQTGILTSDKKSSAKEIVESIFSRWRQENYFKIMGREYGLDVFSSYATEEVKLIPMVTNPRIKELRKKKREIKKRIEKIQSNLAEKIIPKNERGLTSRAWKKYYKEQLEELEVLKREHRRLINEVREVPKKVPLTDVLIKRRLEVFKFQKKLLIDIMRILAYNVNEKMIMLLSECYPKGYRHLRKILKMMLIHPTYVRLKGDKLFVKFRDIRPNIYRKVIKKVCNRLNKMNPKTLDECRYNLIFQVE